jgi:hypothetical protein
MKYKGKEIGELTTQELIDAAFDLNDKTNKFNEARQSSRFKRKVGDNVAPTPINPAFLAMKAEVYAELKKRG